MMLYNITNIYRRHLGNKMNSINMSRRTHHIPEHPFAQTNNSLYTSSTDAIYSCYQLQHIVQVIINPTPAFFSVTSLHLMEK